MWLFLLFLCIPLIEITLFIQVGGLIGLWPTLAIVISTAFLGTWLVRQQGAMALGQLRGSLARMDDPTTPLAHGAMILIAGVLLLTPGFFTDAIGFALLIPAVRNAVMRAVAARVEMRRFEMNSAQRPSQQASDTIETDYTEVDPNPHSRHGSSGWTKH